MPIYTPGKLVLKKDSVATDPNTDPNFASVSLLLYGNGINGSTTITDNSPSPKTVTAVGNAQISTAQSKFGGASIAFDGTGSPLDHLSIPAGTVDLQFGAQDFTIECWVYRLDTNTGTIAIGQADLASASGSSWLLYVSSSLASDIYSGSTTYGVTSPNPSINTWAHVALTRSGGTLRSFLDGAIVGTNTSLGATSVNNGSTAYPNTIGGLANGLRGLNGYIDDLRITKGVARYTANFTPPQNQLPNF
jgi:hypothetical protein